MQAFAALDKGKCRRTDGRNQQQRGDCQPVVAFGQHVEFGIVAGLVKGMVFGGAARGRFGCEARLVIGAALAVGTIEIGNRRAGQAGQMRDDTGGFQKRLQLAHRNREKEGRIGAVVADRAKAVDAKHTPASVEQRPTRIARAQLRGVQDRVELLR